VLDRAAAERALGREPYDARDHVLAAEPMTEIRFDREVPEADARAIETVDGAPLAIDPRRGTARRGQGTTGTVPKVALTANEVDHARQHAYSKRSRWCG
jgi:hypothetical protein